LDIALFFLEKHARKNFFNISKIIHSDEEKLQLTRAATTRTMRQRFSTVKQDLVEPSLPVSLASTILAT